jgi:hypothetical protein
MSYITSLGTAVSSIAVLSPALRLHGHALDSRQYSVGISIEVIVVSLDANVACVAVISSCVHEVAGVHRGTTDHVNPALETRMTRPAIIS